MASTEPAIWFPTVRCHSGVDVFTERLVQALTQRGYRAEITWLPLRAEYAPWSVPVPQPPPWATVVHVNSWLHPRFFPLHLPVVSTLHSCVHDPALRPYKRPAQAAYHALWIRGVEAANLRCARRVVAVSRYTAEAAKKVFGPLDIEVIHNGVDTDFFTPVARSSPNKPFRLLYVGNWSRRKGVDLLAPILTQLGQSFELVYTADRQGKHSRFPLPDNCRCLGRLDATALREAYRDADALLFPSRLEGLPLTVLEAMACGLPVITAASSAMPEIVVQGETGWLCPLDDAAAFAGAARQLAIQPQCWRAMRDAAHRRAVERFALKRQVKLWLKHYQQLVERPHA